ncbi:putative DNA binding domain-containing protein [Delftia sp. DLF01]|uniref:ATP-binding protein n=1 Tax=Delftia sp. DLF01 TaxID=2769279 RepID=UPI0017861E51|nr:ATP-binding protein [Delftia sp. DLF01]MBD9582821.1 putative DNA binding domain-containing protein [Delftia sp. DLF01]
MNSQWTRDNVDLNSLLLRESEQVEWKENVADTDDVVETICAFANDWSNLGGGYVVCGAAEKKDVHGFPAVELVGLTSARLREIEGKVLTACRDRIFPGVVPLVHEMAGPTPDRRILVFIVASTRHAHTLRRGDDTGKHYVRLSRETREARDGILRELLVRKGDVEPWDRRICISATTNDLDLVAFRDALQRMNVFDPNRGIDDYLSDTHSLSPFVPPLCGRDPLTGQLRPRNYAMLLFARQLQLHVPGAYALLSIYPGIDRSEPHAERHELAGSIIEQARRSIDLLGVQSHVAFDKTNAQTPNALKYPRQALTEAMINALAHRDYELHEPTRTTVFSDRIEISSSGSLPTGIRVETFEQGKATSKWRNQSLAWFLNRLQLAQAEGQGIPTIIRSMREEGCPAPSFEVTEANVTCRLPAHPRHALAREYSGIEEAISLGEFSRAKDRVDALLKRDPLNHRAVVLLTDVALALGDVSLVRNYVAEHSGHLNSLSPTILARIADALTLHSQPTQNDREEARRLYLAASQGYVEEREVRKLAQGLSRSGDDHAAVEFLDKQFREHPEWRNNPSLLQVRGNAYIGMAKQCSRTARFNNQLPSSAKRRAWDDCRRFLTEARRDLEQALSTDDQVLKEIVKKNLEFAIKQQRAAGADRERHSQGKSKT